jgi:hypothetical protein
MTLPLTGPALLALGIVSGLIFGALLQRSRLSDTAVTIGQLRLKDFTLFKVMLAAIVVGGIGVLVLHAGGLAAYHIKPANLVAVAIGAVLFGVGMAVYGYCPGTGLAAIGTGSLHALAGALGMLAGAIAFACSFDWLKAHILPLAAFGPVRLPDLTGVPDLAWFLIVIVVGFGAIRWAERRSLT